MLRARTLVWILIVASLAPGAVRAALEPRPPEPALLFETAGRADNVDPGAVFGSSDGATMFYFFEHGFGEDGAPFNEDDTLRVPLWRTDGTPAGTAPVLSPEYSFFYGEEALDGLVLFAACRSEEPGDFPFGQGCGAPFTNELWRSDGTPAGTFPLLEERGSFLGFSGVETVPELGLAFFLAHFGDDSGWELWATDGTAEGTRLVQALAPLGYDFNAGFASFGGALYILVSEDTPEARAWVGRSDGTPGGTTFFPAPFDGDTRPRRLVPGETRLFLLVHGPEEDPVIEPGADSRRMTLWSVAAGEEDWSPAGDLGFWPRRTNPHPVAGRGRVFVRLDDLFHDVTELWGSDGTAEGGERLAEIPSFASFLIEVYTEPLGLPGGRAFLRLFDETHGTEPWTSDGTAAGTAMLANLCPGECNSFPRGVGVGSGGSYLFTAFDEASGWALRRWRPATGALERVADLCAPDCSSGPRPVGNLADRLLFATTDSAGVPTLWEVDEPRSSARRIADLEGLEIDAFQIRTTTTSAEWALAGDRWVFWGQGRGRGLSVWSLALPGSVPQPPAGPALTSDEVPGFAFKVRIGGDEGLDGRAEADCIPETLCVSGALPGRSEVFVRIVGPKPNGKLWPTLVKFTTSTAEVWIEQLATGAVRYYRLEGATPGSSELPGLFDRDGFSPVD